MFIRDWIAGFDPRGEVISDCIALVVRLEFKTDLCCRAVPYYEVTFDD